MDKDESKVQGEEGAVKIDDWAAAFAALDQEVEDTPQTDPSGTGGADDAAETAGVKEVPDSGESGDGSGDAPTAGGLDSVPNQPGQEGAGVADGLFQSGESDRDFGEYRKQVESEVAQQAEDDIKQELIKRGVRNSDGKLGATLKDEDIRKYDEDGVPHFYNPETGQEFRGDNPRQQAKDWVDDYNEELNDLFEKAVANYKQQLLDTLMPQLAVMEFAPTYNKLDPVRKLLFEQMIAGHEVYDEDGSVKGHDKAIDYNDVLARVNKMVSGIQEYARANRPATPPSGPSLDMKTSSGAIPSGERTAPKSLAEAMEQLQDMELEKYRR